MSLRTSGGQWGLGWAAATALAGLAMFLVGVGFHPEKASLDLSNQAAEASIVSGAQIAPDRRFPGVMGVYDRGEPLVLTMPLTTRDAHVWRIKLAFQEPGQQVHVALNGRSITTLTAVKGRDEAEKFQLLTRPGDVLAGPNLLQLTSGAPAGAVRYEQVQARNFRAVLIFDAAYVVPRENRVTRLQAPGMVAGVFLGGLALWLLMVAGGGLVAWATATPFDRAVVWQWLPVPFLTAALLAGAILGGVTAYRLVLSPLAAAVFTAGAAAAHYLLVAGLVGMWRVLQAAIRMVMRLGRLRTKTAGVPQDVLKTGERAWAMMRIIGGGLATLMVHLLTRWLPQSGRAAWRWWSWHQTAQGYAHFFLYLLVVAAVFWVAGAKLVADRVSEWAWCALMISALLYTWRACRLPESDETSSL